MWLFKWFGNLNWLLNYLKFENLIINEEITQLNIELEKSKGIEFKANTNVILLILHINTISLHLYLKWKEDYISDKQKKPKTKLFLIVFMKSIF
jgi:hypothetical protein